MKYPWQADKDNSLNLSLICLRELFNQNLLNVLIEGSNVWLPEPENIYFYIVRGIVDQR